jgi:hypothetical protein
MTHEKYTIDFSFSELEILKVWLKEMHYNERSAHDLDVFLREKIQDAEIDANLSKARELNQEAKELLSSSLPFQN